MRKLVAAAAVFFVATTSALAHHPLGGLPMETFLHGVLSGIGHPVLGFDHLLFVCAAGIAATYSNSPRLAVLSYVGAMLCGCFLMAMGVGLPFKEPMIAVSLLIVGALVILGRKLPLAWTMLLFVVFGVFHGSAFGDSIAAQEAGAGLQVLSGYLIGLGVVQYALAMMAGYTIRRFFHADLPSAIEARVAGALVAGAGLFLTLEVVEGALLGAMGWVT